jgi:glycosyltransferase involved in cell wall biosynthesis
LPKFAIIGSRGYPNYYGGFETLVRHLGPYLADQGHDVTVYARETGIGKRSDVVDGITTRFTSGLDRKAVSTLSFGRSAIADAVRRHFDAALILNVANGLFLKKLANAGIPTAVNVDGLEWERAKWGRVAKRTFLRGANESVRHANELIFDSRVVEQVWEHRFGRKGTFIPYGAPVLQHKSTSRLKTAGLPSSGYLLAVMRIVPENNLDLLLDALDHLPRSIPTVVVGDSNYKHPTVHRLRNMSNAGRVTALGHVNDQDLLNDLWMNCAVYWHGHSVGGTNPSLLQAMGAGAPCLALDTPFNREVLDNDEHLVNGEPKAVAKSVEAILESPDRAQRMREWGRRVIADRYTWQAICQSYEDVLLKLAKQPAHDHVPMAAEGRLSA